MNQHRNELSVIDTGRCGLELSFLTFHTEDPEKKFIQLVDQNLDVKVVGIKLCPSSSSWLLLSETRGH